MSQTSVVVDRAPPCSLIGRVARISTNGIMAVAPFG
jgi:hypothetical protein